ncbi:translation repressor RelE [Gammaproteobacteria bacterium]|nr:translation repressor RelE [Gammaproteobacteria bacterium]
MKTGADKRAVMPRITEYAKSFFKDWERLNHSGRYDMHKIKIAMWLLIANDELMPLKYKDHSLIGNWDGYRECHIGGDFLMIYQLDFTGKIIVFNRAGTHAELFK